MAGAAAEEAAPPGAVDDLLVDWIRAAVTRHGDRHQVLLEDVWCHVQDPTAGIPVQGWKLHLSATPLSASLVLSRAAAELLELPCAFKFARSVSWVRRLTSREAPRGSGGKFLTVYPLVPEEELGALAERLHRATRGLPGPRILSDRPYAPESLVHYRYGAFTGVDSLSNDGDREAMLRGPDGELLMDRRRAWFSPPPWVDRDPFTGAELRPPAPPASAPAAPVLLDGRFLVREVIRHSFTGGVYRAVDETTGQSVVLKQARPHTGAEITGEDMVSVRRREATMLTRFADSGVTPQLVRVFRQQQELFVAQEQVTGGTLRSWVNRNLAVADGSWGPPAAEVLRLAREVVSLVSLVHRHGLVLRDLNPNNVMVTDDAQVRLIDLEALAEPGSTVVRVHTPGYAAPEQVAAADIGPAPRQSADLYSLGATLFHLATGLDPVLPEDGPARRSHADRVRDWLAALAGQNPAARLVAPLVARLLADDESLRPSLADVRGHLDAVAAQAASRGAAAPGTPPRTAHRHVLPSFDSAIADGIGHLVATMDPVGPRLWPTSESGASTDPVNVQHGAAGVLGVLARAHRGEPRAYLGGAIGAVAAWIESGLAQPARTLPGLYFGRSGTAFALVEAGRAVGDEAMVRRGLDLAAQVPTRWPNPDVCHGAAGSGLLQLRSWEVSGEEVFRRRAEDVADGLVAAAVRRDDLVLWPVPANFDSALAGITHYGFAHGAAGVGSFLLAAGLALGTQEYVDVAVEAARGLCSVAEIDGGAAYWPSSREAPLWKSHWCSGSSGVATFLARVWAVTGDRGLAPCLEAAAVAVHRSRWTAGPSQCHGLAGDADFLLDLAELTGDTRYRAWAEQLAASIYLRHGVRQGRRLPPDETGMAIVADYGTGLGGVLALLLRLRDGGPRLWLPASFTDPTGFTDPSDPRTHATLRLAERR